jgi:hypothetical protein
MKFSTPSILCLVALVAITIVSSSCQVSARKNDGSFVGKKVLKKSKSSPKSESSSILPPSSSMEESLLTLYGLDRNVPLTKDEAEFLEAVIQYSYNEVEDDYSAKSVLIEDDVIDYDDEDNNRSLLRGSSNNKGVRNLVSDQEMCHDENFEVIPGCTFEMDFYIDPYCTHCLSDDEPNMTREPSSAPSLPPTLPPTRDPCNDPNNYRIGIACDDDDSHNSGYKNYKNKVSRSDEDEDVVSEQEQEQGPQYPPPPTGTHPVDEIIPVVPPIISRPIRPTRPTMAEIILKKLNKSRFNRFKSVQKVRVSSYNNDSSRFGGGN